MKPTLCQFVLFIFILGKEIDLVSSVCGPRQYYSEDIPGCVYCPVNCGDQGHDTERCKKACETKTTAAPTPTPTPRLATKTTVPKSDPQSTTTEPPKVQNTTRLPKTTQLFRNTLESSNSERPGKTGKKIDFVSSCGPRQYYSEDIPGCVSCPVNCADQGRDIERCKKACGKKIDLVSGCGPRQYYSEDIPGCVSCPVNCGEQGSDIERCKKACETITTATTTKLLSTKTKVPKSEVNPQSPTTEPPTTQPSKKTLPSSNSERPGKADSSHVGLAVGLGVSGTLVVCLVAFIVCMWRCSKAFNVSSRDEEAKIEICDEPSTSSQEPSPDTTKRSQSQASSVEEINIICPPWPETEETEKLMPPVPENNHMSCLDLQEREN